MWVTFLSLSVSQENKRVSELWESESPCWVGLQQWSCASVAFSIKRYVSWQLCTGKVKYKLETYCGMSCVKKNKQKKQLRKKQSPTQTSIRKAKKRNPYYCKVWFLIKWKRTSCAIWWTSSHFLHPLPKSITEEVRGQRRWSFMQTSSALPSGGDGVEGARREGGGTAADSLAVVHGGLGGRCFA